MKVLLVSTVQSHIGQFHRPLADMLHARGAQVHVAARDNLAEKNGLKLDFADRVFDVPFARSPKSRENVAAYRQLKEIIDREGYDIVHCNTPMGGIVARLAARKARKKGTKVFYTAHGFHFYKGAPLKSWLVYYPIEKWFADRYTDQVITITREDYALAKKKFKTQVRHMHGVGANSGKFFPVEEDERLRLREQYGYGPDTPVLLCVGELNKNKNQQMLLHALAEVRRTVPDCCLLLAGDGPQLPRLQELVRELGLAEAVTFLGYTMALDRYLHMVDLAVSVSLREGLPFNIMEAMLCRVPVVASHNRGHRELICHEETGLLVSPTDPSEIARSIIALLQDRNAGKAMAQRAYENICRYTDRAVRQELENIYAKSGDTQ